MANTIKISKAKNTSFKKLSFLYLVFILFIFFTSPGLYVSHYPSMSVTQEELNARLSAELKAFSSDQIAEMELRNSTFELVDRVDALKVNYEEWAKANSVTGDKLKDNNYAEKVFRGTSLMADLQSILQAYMKVYGTIGEVDLNPDFVRLKDLANNEFDAMEYFFKETPNGVVPSIFEHFKTVMLYQSLLHLNENDVELPKFEILTVEESDFIERFKRALILGENLDLIIRPREGDGVPVVRINGSPVEISQQPGTRLYRVSYLPAQAGNYSLEITVGEERVVTSFRVESPAFRFIHERSNLRAEVGEKSNLSLDSSFVPPGNRVQFSSNAADIERTGYRLAITPQKEGKFEVLMSENGQVVDKVTFYASMPRSPKVALMDMSGLPVEFQKAHRLESTNTFWQVVDFDMVVVSPDGQRQRYHSATRYLRSELRDAEAKAPAGSTLIFDNIKLLAQNGQSTLQGQPIVISK
jgi:hypothetical protein